MSLALATAVLALIVEDLLPKPDPDARWVVARVIWLLIVLAVLIAAIAARGWAQRRTGTLFYLRLQDESATDLHTEAVQAARVRHLATRTVARWVDLAHHTNDQVIDLVQPCQELAVALEQAVNQDRDDTGYTVAPNLLWPAALAVGRQLPNVDNLVLLELQSAAGRSTQELKIDDSCDDKLCEVVGCLDLPGDGRVGLWLRFTEHAANFNAERFCDFGVTTAYAVQRIGGELPTSDKPLTDRELAQLAQELPACLIEQKKAAGQRELVVIAMMPKVVAFTIGWRVAQANCRFFAGTHLMHYDQVARDYLAMRVHPSQPITAPQPAGQLDPT